MGSMTLYGANTSTRHVDRICRIGDEREIQVPKAMGAGERHGIQLTDLEEASQRS